MGILDKLIGGGLAEPVEAVGNALDKLFTSDEEKKQAKAVMEKIRQQPHVLQGEISKMEASHRSAFVAGWRPAVGWVCAAGLAFPFCINPVVQWYTGMAGPVMPTADITTLVMALIGLGGLRTAEKVAGKAK